MQGMAMAMRLREIWPDIKLNETHPKVLYHALSNLIYSFGPPMKQWLLRQFAPPLCLEIDNDHDWDALLSAWATWKGLQGTWYNDLMESDMAPLMRPAGEVSYFWP